MTFLEQLQNDDRIRTYIEKSDTALAEIGYTEHSFAHVTKVMETAQYILKTLGYSEHDVELVGIAAYLHDIGNIINRDDHAQSGAIMAFRLLDEMHLPPEDIAAVVSAIGNHDERTGVAVNSISAALILADKCDVRRSRVRKTVIHERDIHDRVNYSVKKAMVKINEEKTIIKLKLTIDTHYSSIMDYFEIFMSRMLLCRRAAKKLGLDFKLIINEQQLV